MKTIMKPFRSAFRRPSSTEFPPPSQNSTDDAPSRDQSPSRISVDACQKKDVPSSSPDYLSTSDSEGFFPTPQSSIGDSSSQDLPPTYGNAVETSREGANPTATQEMDPLVASAYYNQTQSPLMRLLDALLVAIMERLDHDDIIRLRHVSRDFMRLFSHTQVFRKYHLTEAINPEERRYRARAWATPLDLSGLTKTTDNLAKHKHPRCTWCTELLGSRGYKSDQELIESQPFIYCSGCKTEHQATYFSSQQRHESNDDERLCLGREARINLCEHLSISWDIVQRLAPGEQKEITCDRPEHYHSSPCKHVRDQYSASCSASYYKKPRLKYSRHSNKGVQLDFMVSKHIPFKQRNSESSNQPGSGGGGGGGVVSSTVFQADLRQHVLRQFPYKGFHWTSLGLPPHRRLDPIMQIFDPNKCSCLDWGQPPETQAEAQGSALPPAHHTTNLTTSGGGGGGTARDFTWKMSPHPRRGRLDDWGLDNRPHAFTGRDKFSCSPGDRCAGLGHSRWLGSTNDRFLVDFSWCEEGKDFIILTQSLRIVVDTPHDEIWARHLNLDDINRFKDDEMRGITWCDEEMCNWHRAASVMKYNYRVWYLGAI